MGVAITDLLEGKELSMVELNGKILAVDAFNMLYQFLTTIRMSDGTPLKDSKGNITSHLIGLFNRTTTLMSKGLKLVFVFDGQAPELKKAERERRNKVKAQALMKLKEAEEAEDIEGMKKYSGRTARLDADMIAEAKELLLALGIPVIQALSEGEGQAAHLVKKGDAYAVVSQDADSFLFGAAKVIRNLNLSGKRKKTNTLAYEKVMPELLQLDATLNKLKLTQDQLIVLSILVGTDYNREGIKGIGPKKALKLLERHGENFEKLFEEVKWTENYDFSWQEIMKIFKELPCTDDYELKWKPMNQEAINKLLIEKHDFSEERISATLKKLNTDAIKQKGLSEFF